VFLLFEFHLLVPPHFSLSASDHPCTTSDLLSFQFHVLLLLLLLLGNVQVKLSKFTQLNAVQNYIKMHKAFQLQELMP
jgi:hypothetical protein